MPRVRPLAAKCPLAKADCWHAGVSAVRDANRVTLFGLRCSVVGLVSITAVVLSQAVLAVDPLQPNAATQLQLLQPAVVPQAMHLWIFDLHPACSAGVTYDDNIALNSTNRLHDWIWQFSPHIVAESDKMEGGYGTSLTLDYMPNLQVFTEHSDDDNLDEHASIAGVWAMSKLTLGLRQSYDEVKTGVAEVGERLRQDTYDTELSSRYILGEKTFVEFNPRMTISQTENLIGTTEWGVDGFLNRILTSKITGGVGGSGGYVAPSYGPEQTYGRGLLHLQYAATGKLDLDASCGEEWRNYHGERSDTLTPVFGLGAAYRLRERTTITLEGRRAEVVSGLLTNQDYITTGATVGIREQVADRVQVYVTGSYDNRSYNATKTAVEALRRDALYQARGGIDITVGRHLTFDVYYQYERDDSNVALQNFTDDQVGLSGSWKL
jgi:hypothetical protein